MITILTFFLKKVVRIFDQFLGLTLWVFGLGIAAWYPMRWWPGDRLTPVQLLNYIMPWLLVALIPALVIAALTRRRWLAALLVIPILLIVYSYAPLFLPRSTSPVLAESNRIKVMSYNILSRNDDLQEVANIIRQEQPDLLLLQEVYGSTGFELKEALSDLYDQKQFHYTMDPIYGQGIVSRFPLTPLGTSYNQGRTQKAILHTPQADILVWNTHFKQPRYWTAQHRQASNLVKALDSVDQPIIVGGDFNTTEQSQVYSMINRHLKNAHWQAGWGLGFSYPADHLAVKGIAVPMPGPLVRIDHIFHSDHFLTRSAETLPYSGGSDHLPVVSELSLIR